MKHITDTIRKAVNDTAENGIITSKRVSELGIHRSSLAEMVMDGELYKCSRGIYLAADEWEDEFAILQLKYSRGIFSHSTALYLHGYSERVPLSFHMTFPTNYNSKSLKEANVEVTRVIKENYELGISSVRTPAGNIVKAYDLERSLCDLFRGRSNDIQDIQFAMKKYAVSKERDINKLMRYAEKLHVEAKVRRYMEVLL